MLDRSPKLIFPACAANQAMAVKAEEVKNDGKMAERSMACDSSESLPARFRFLILVRGRGFKSHSCHNFLTRAESDHNLLDDSTKQLCVRLLHLRIHKLFV